MYIHICIYICVYMYVCTVAFIDLSIEVPQAQALWRRAGNSGPPWGGGQRAARRSLPTRRS